MRTKRRREPLGGAVASGSFDERVWAEIRKIPPGQVKTYGEIARQLETRAFRAVGRACRNSPGMPDVPCHRVVSSEGLLHGFNGGLARKRALLEEEGVKTRRRLVRGKVDYEVMPREAAVKAAVKAAGRGGRSDRPGRV